ncbi:TonB-dependent receptor [Dasania sp. GY-MA-18]|uniref:TonB-dependent receptor n=1 Tax=Dasania phycosphaerae TaxID=2950436 RepID=A0A9J6RLH6_9GAMM|nr:MULTISPECIES: TonB-dependent receptor [Dasania]MCR8923142.1 TonB-dependent receptor [Dasania sp. GY-MA-18]MCZ0865574.1 TonB-dependent receptor [Dasania phycosphaerae]MCZ0869299.1 TonB-dependent receptor [Dasania phycosphaerae]
MKNTVNLKKLSLAVSMAVAAQAAITPLAHALQMEEVAVTARKQTESAQDVPIAISAFSGDLMTDLGVSESGDIALFTPNFTWHTEFGRASPQPYMRGIGTNNFSPINNGPIAIYQDNVFIGPNVAQGFATFDVERVEVLKGPQGTLYGRNSTGGLINFISVKPEIGAGVTGYVNAEIGSHNTRNIEGAVGFDLGDSAAGRVSFLRAENDGYTKNINPESSGDAGIVDDIALRAQLLVDAADGLSILTNVHYGKADPDTAPFKNVGLQDPNSYNPATYSFEDPCANPGLGSGCTDLYTGFVDNKDLYKTSKADDSEEVKTVGIFVNVDYDIDGEKSLHSITSYDEAELRRFDDVDDGAIGLENDYYADDFTWYSQELRLSSNTDESIWHAGAYYYHETAEGTQIWTNPIFGAGEGNEHEIETTSYAFFGQYGTDLSERWSFTGGLRWTYEEKDIKKYNGFMPLISNPGNYGDGVLYSLAEARAAGGIDESYGITVGTPRAKDWDEITGRISFDYRTDNDNLVYISLSRGFKGGDVNGAAFLDDYIPTTAGDNGLNPGCELAAGSTRCADSVAAFQAKLEPVDPELLDAFEIGFKGDFLDGNLRVNGAVFYYDYQDQQNTILFQVPGVTGPQGSTTVLANAASTEMPGLEFEIIATPTENWYLQFNGGWLDAEYDDFGDNTGNQISLTPKTQFSGLVRYDFNLESGAIIAVQTDVSWQSKTYFQPTNKEHLEQDAYALWGARFSYTSSDDRWTTALFAKNLGDKEYFGSGFDVSSLGYLALKPGAPRYIGLSVDYKFGG